MLEDPGKRTFCKSDLCVSFTMAVTASVAIYSTVASGLQYANLSLKDFIPGLQRDRYAQLSAGLYVAVFLAVFLVITSYPVLVSRRLWTKPWSALLWVLRTSGKCVAFVSRGALRVLIWMLFVPVFIVRKLAQGTAFASVLVFTLALRMSSLFWIALHLGSENLRQGARGIAYALSYVAVLVLKAISVSGSILKTLAGTGRGPRLVLGSSAAVIAIVLSFVFVGHHKTKAVPTALTEDQSKVVQGGDEKPSTSTVKKLPPFKMAEIPRLPWDNPEVDPKSADENKVAQGIETKTNVAQAKVSPAFKSPETDPFAWLDKPKEAPSHADNTKLAKGDEEELDKPNVKTLPQVKLAQIDPATTAIPAYVAPKKRADPRKHRSAKKRPQPDTNPSQYALNQPGSAYNPDDGLSGPSINSRPSIDGSLQPNDFSADASGISNSGNPNTSGDSYQGYGYTNSGYQGYGYGYQSPSAIYGIHRIGHSYMSSLNPSPGFGSLDLAGVPHSMFQPLRSSLHRF